MADQGAQLAGHGTCSISTTGFLDLPAELREPIYRQYLANLKPTSFNIAKHPQRPQWTLKTSGFRCTPVFLLVCKSVSTEFKEFMLETISDGPVDDFPISSGPMIKIEPRFSALNNVDDESGDQPRETDCANEILKPLLLHGIFAMRLRLVMPQSPEDAVLFRTMLQYISALCNARKQPLKHIRAIRDPVSGPGWGPDFNALSEYIKTLRCETLERENWYRPWFRPNLPEADRFGDDTTAGVATEQAYEIGVDEAWAYVLESCREHGRGQRWKAQQLPRSRSPGWRGVSVDI